MADKTTNFYNPEPLSGETKTVSGAEVSWQAPQFIEHHHPASWYAGLAAAALILATGVYLLTKDYFSAGSIVIVSIILGFYANHKPKLVTYHLSDDGIKSDDKLMSFKLFKSYSMIKDGQTSSLNLDPVKRLMPTISIYYAPQDEAKIESILSEHLAMDDRPADRIDRLAHRLKI